LAGLAQEVDKKDAQAKNVRFCGCMYQQQAEVSVFFSLFFL